MFIDTENTTNAQASQQNTAYIDSLKIIFSAFFDRNREMSGWQKSAALVAVKRYRSSHQAHRMPQTHHEPEITTRKGRYCLVGKWLKERLCSLQILTKQWSNQVVCVPPTVQDPDIYYTYNETGIIAYIWEVSHVWYFYVINCLISDQNCW